MRANFPAPASLFIWQSHSSSLQPQRSEMTSARSSKDSLLMAALISETLLTIQRCLPERILATLILETTYAPLCALPRFTLSSSHRWFAQLGNNPFCDVCQGLHLSVLR